jgi:hypothetical protein
MRSVAAYGHLAETALIERLRYVDDSYLDTTIPSKNTRTLLWCDVWRASKLGWSAQCDDTGGLITRKALHMPDTPMKSNQGEQCCQHPSENANNVVLALGKAEQNHHLS